MWLADLAARTRRIVDRRKVFDTGDCSSDGRHFLLRQGWWANGCRQFEVALWGGISVRDLGGRELGGAQGGATWSADGKLALAFGGVSGTAVTYMQPMSVISTTTGRQGLLLPNRIEGVPLAGPGGWILYARYDPTKLRPDEAPLVSARLYLARLIPRWRR